MKYPHIVNYNGVLYPAGADVPDGVSPSEKVEEKPTKTEQVSKEESAPILQKSGKKPRVYSKDTIRRMSSEECKAYAKELGFNGVEEMTATEVKRNIVMYLKL